LFVIVLGASTVERLKQLLKNSAALECVRLCEPWRRGDVVFAARWRSSNFTTERASANRWKLVVEGCGAPRDSFVARNGSRPRAACERRSTRGSAATSVQAPHAASERPPASQRRITQAPTGELRLRQALEA